MRLIDADKLEAYRNTIVPKNSITEYYLLGAKDVFEYIDSMPTVDAVPVIRCKDCKHNKSNEWVDCPITEFFGRTLDNYCSIERKEE